MLLRNGKRVGENQILGECECNAGYHASSLFGGKCSACYKQAVRKRSRRTKPYVWEKERDAEMRERETPQSSIETIKRNLRSGSTVRLLVELEWNKKNGRYLSFEQAVEINLEASAVDALDRVHYIFPYVYDRWNIQFRDGVPAYSVCYYGPDLFHDKKSFERIIANPVFLGNNRRALDEAKKLVEEL